MLKAITALLLLVLSLTLHGCTTSVSGLKGYVDSTDGYEFLYPNGWVEVQVTDGPDVVFHDLIERTENVSVVMSSVPEGKTLTDLGTPGEVGYQLQKNAIAPPNSGRQAELVNAEARESGDKTYYLLEYNVKLPNQERHNIASVAVSRGKLYTFNASTTEQRWGKMHDVFEIAAKSFSVY
ncbi:MAG: photosystem II reaction center PsbP [Cyanobacteriota bacterium]